MCFWMSLRSVLPGSSWLHSPIFWFTCESNPLEKEGEAEEEKGRMFFNIFFS